MPVKTVLPFCLSVLASCNVSFAQQPRLVLPIGHTGKIFEAHFSPDGKKVITASKDKTAKLWDAASGYLLADLKRHNAPVLNAQFSPDGQLILTHANDVNAENNEMHEYKIWSGITGEFIADLDASITTDAYATFTPDSKLIVTSSDSVKLWDAATGKFSYSLDIEKEKIWMKNSAGKTVGYTWNNIQLNFSPDGQWILVPRENKSLLLLDAITGKRKKTLTGYTALVKNIVFIPGGKVITASGNETVIWDAGSWQMVKKISGKIPEDGYLFFLTPDGKKIVKAEFILGVSVWDAATRKLLFSKKGKKLQNEVNHPPAPEGMEVGRVLIPESIAASNEKLAAVLNKTYHNRWQLNLSNDKTALLWNINKGQITDSLKGHTSAINFIDFSGDGKKLVTASDDGTARIWDAGSGALLADLKGHSFNASSGAFSPPTTEDPTGGKWMVTTSDDGTLKIWESGSMKLRDVFKGPAEKIFSVQYSRDGKKIVSASKDGSLIVWDAVSGKQVRFENIADVRIDPTVESDLEEVTQLVAPEISPDGSNVLTAIQGKSVQLFDATSKKLLLQLDNKNFPGVSYNHFSPDGSKIIAGWRYYDNYNDGKEKNCIVADAQSGKILFRIEATDARFSPDSKKIAAVAGIGNIKVWDTENGSLLFNLSTGPNRELAEMLPVFSPDGKKILAFDWHDSTAGFWDAANGHFLYNLKGVIDMKFAAFSPDNKKVLILTIAGAASIWNAETGELLNILTGHTDAINYIGFSPDSKQVLTTSKDFTSKIWDASTGKCITSFFSADNAEYFALLPSGYYQSSPNAAKLLNYVTKDLKIISFEQLDVKYNRPDLVLEAIGNPDTILINTYRNAYYKRIKKLGIDTTSFRDGYSVPEADFVNREEIPSEQKDDTLSLHIKGMDSTYKLDRYNVWVNEVPVYGQRGISIRKNNSNSIDKSITVKLSQGENRIETSVTNVNGTESYRKPLVVNYIPAAKQKETTYFIGIGIDQFAETSRNLQYSAKDIRDLAVKLKEKYGDNIIIDTLFNENVTVSNVKALKQKLQNTAENDKVVISYSGHGLLSKDFEYYLSTYSVNFNEPEENGLPYDELENLLDSIPARKKLMLIDACHSGEVDKEDLVRINAVSDSMKLKKGATVVSYKKNENHLGLKNSFELMQSLFVNVGKSTGATIISAAGGTQFALERNDLKNGVFTYAILEAMKNRPVMKISELKKIVGERVLQLTNGMQKPTSRNETIAVDWSIW
jgi:WD40 repeat protein